MINGFSELNEYQQHKYRIISGQGCLRYMENIFRRVNVGNLALSGEDYPYCLPMNHFYKDGAFYYHCAFLGKKVGLMQKNPKACFTVHGPIDPLGKDERYYHHPWMSAVCYGTLSQETDLDVKLKIVNEYTATQGAPAVAMDRIKACNLIKFSIEKITARYGRFNPAENRILMLWDYQGNGDYGPDVTMMSADVTEATLDQMLDEQASKN